MQNGGPPGPRRDKQHNSESAIWADRVSSRGFEGLGLLVWSPYPANSNKMVPVVQYDEVFHTNTAVVAPDASRTCRTHAL